MHATSGYSKMNQFVGTGTRFMSTRSNAILRRTVTMALLLGAGFTLSGCAEFVHMGRMSDREYASSVAGVKIEQQQEDGSWKQLGETDGSGKWWIMRSEYKGGGRIRLSKKGYGTQVMTDNEFMQASSMLMSPITSDESDTNAPWR